MAVTDFSTKAAVVVRDDLVAWQRLNVTAFLVSGLIGAAEGEAIGHAYATRTPCFAACGVIRDQSQLGGSHYSDGRSMTRSTTPGPMEPPAEGNSRAAPPREPPMPRDVWRNPISD